MFVLLSLLILFCLALFCSPFVFWLFAWNLLPHLSEIYNMINWNWTEISNSVVKLPLFRHCSVGTKCEREKIILWHRRWPPRRCLLFPVFQCTREVECNTTEQKKRKPVWEWDRSPSPILAGPPKKTNGDIHVSFGIKTNVYIYDWGLNDWGVSVPKSPLPYFFRFPSMSLWRQTRVWKTRISLSDHWALKIHWQWAYLQTVSATVTTLRTVPTHSAWTGEESYAAFASKLCIKAQYQIFSPHDYHGPRIHKKKAQNKKLSD